jgi:signal transduction histidine kinase
LLHLVNDVLEVARTDATQLQLPMELLLTSAATSSAIALVQPQATARGIRLLDLHAGSGVAYVGDEHRVRQILVNLLSNAVKFTPPGGMVTLDFARVGSNAPDAPKHRHSVESGHTWACISVHDTGIGIPPELMHRLFEPFVQGTPEAQTASGGTGLGLTISRRLLGLHTVVANT